jgi:hypothetical protein
MIVSVSGDGGIEVRDGADCRALAVRAEPGAADAGAVLTGAGLAGAADGDAAWLIVERLREAARPAGAAGWDERFDAMIAFAAEHGWVTASGEAVRAHIERA